MKLISLQLQNFRSFYGTSPLITFGRGTKNVTVVHGGNGSGKTTLLNAFTWLLFQEHSKGFLFPDQIANKRAIREARPGETIDAWVQLIFEHEDRKYVMKRTVQVTRTKGEPGWQQNGDSSATLQSADASGQWENLDRISDTINRILPKDLHTYFFFDGERIERIAQPTPEDLANLANATKKFLGLEILERAEKHLKSAQGDLEKELKAIGDPETVRLLNEKSEHEAVVEQLEGDIKQLNQNIEANKTLAKALAKRLGELEGVKQIQARRDKLNIDLEAKKQDMAKGRQRQAALINTDGYNVFLRKASASFRDLVEKLRRRGELPSGIKRQFVNDLLDREICICGRGIDSQNPEARKAVEAWMARAGLADVEETAIRMGGEIAKMEQSITGFWDQFDQIQNTLSSDRRAWSKIEEELEQIAAQLKNSPKEEVSGLEKQLEGAQERTSEDQQTIGKHRGKIEQLTQQIKELDSQIQQHGEKKEKQRLTQRRIDAAREAITRIAQVRTNFEAEYREQLEKKIGKLFKTISYKPYVPEVRPDYSLHLLESAGGPALPVATSQGESQVLSLSFIGSIIEQARENQKRKNRLPGPDSSSYPIVTDAPFGSLDPLYRRQIAENLPQLADQLVILVSKSQWAGEVANSITSKVGAHYVLTFYTPDGNQQTDSIELAGISYDLIKKSPNGFEYTEIQEVKNG